jgi:hypothetical protein
VLNRRIALIGLFVWALGVIPSLDIVSASQAASLRASGRSACRSPGSRTLAEDGAGRIYAVGTDELPSLVFGCLYSTGKARRFRLPAEADGFSIFRIIPLVTLRAPWAAYSWLAVQGKDVLRTGVVVENLRTGKLAHVDPAISEIPGRVYGPGEIVMMVLKGNGSLAWAAEALGYIPPHIQIQSDGVEGHKLLEEGSEVDPTSLSLHGSTLDWLNAGALRSAHLR